MKTGIQIAREVYTLLRSSSLSAMVSGDVYLEGMRPRDSRKEDIVVIYTGGLDGDIQRGVVTINIYVPDTDPYGKGNGVHAIDGQRCEELEVALSQWIEELSQRSTGDYWFWKDQTVSTDCAPEIDQHFVVAKLRYKLVAF